MLERFQLAPQSTAFFEDMARNLTPAHALGMTTVLVADSGEDTLEAMNMPAEYRDIEEDHIHHKTDNLAAFLKQLAAIF